MVWCLVRTTRNIVILVTSRECLVSLSCTPFLLFSFSGPQVEPTLSTRPQQDSSPSSSSSFNSLPLATLPPPFLNHHILPCDLVWSLLITFLLSCIIFSPSQHNTSGSLCLDHLIVLILRAIFVSISCLSFFLLFCIYYRLC